MRLFVQILSGMALTWFAQQDFYKWCIWEELAQDFVRQYKFNINTSLTTWDLLEVRRMYHESFDKYAIRWQLEASKISPSIPEEDLVQIFLKSLDGIYFQKMFFLIGHSFESLISIGKKLEYEISAGRIIDVSTKLSIFQTSKSPSEVEKRIHHPPYLRHKATRIMKGFMLFLFSWDTYWTLWLTRFSKQGFLDPSLLYPARFSKWGLSNTT